MRDSVEVIGAGVIGLSCAIRLAEAGYDVLVRTADHAEHTTSAVAGGLWLPYRAEPADRVAQWAAATLHEFLRLHQAGEASVLLRTGRLLHRETAVRPSWTALVADLVQLRELSDPAPGYRFGYEIRVPVVDMPRYLARLRARLISIGGRIVRDRLPALPERGLVVNATGLASRELAADPSLYAVRGQTLVLDNPGLTEWLSDEDETPDGALTYVLPRADDVVVGGTAHERDERREPDPAQAEAILRRAVELVPQLRGVAIRASRVGLRPARPAVRLEAESTPGRTVVHCYGHGGSGVTLSWGCADDVKALLERA